MWIPPGGHACASCESSSALRPALGNRRFTVRSLGARTAQQISALPAGSLEEPETEHPLTDPGKAEHWAWPLTSCVKEAPLVFMKSTKVSPYSFLPSFPIEVGLSATSQIKCFSMTFHEHFQGSTETPFFRNSDRARGSGTSEQVPINQNSVPETSNANRCSCTGLRILTSGTQVLIVFELRDKHIPLVCICMSPQTEVCKVL